MRKLIALAALGGACLLAACSDAPRAPGEEDAASPRTTTGDSAAATDDARPTFSVPFEKFTLENGLDVVLHVDRSDPVVAIDLAVHVGSGRETPGRTGFAHLFEHLLFLDSENLGYGGLDEMNTRIGGEGTNGFTTTDMTQYYQDAPKDALEKIIWAEADKLGWFINTVTQPVLDNEKQVVKNEKRQSYDNRPFGHNSTVIADAMYPEDHPYDWPVIGSLADLDAATLDDVKTFYRRWYAPNNVTVTLAGDFDPAEARRLMEKYFGEIPRGEDVAPMARRPAVLEEAISLFHEDNFATVPQLTLVWPAVEQYHPDAYALSILAQHLTDGKRAPLNEVLIDEEKLTSGVSSYLYGKEIAGEFYISARGNAGEDLDRMLPAAFEGLQRFEENGISEEDLDRIKAGIEISFYGGVQSALGKAITLGEYNLFKGDPGYLTEDIERTLAVTTDDVMRVYEKYVKGKPYVATSFVPKGSPELALEGATRATVAEEEIVRGTEEDAAFDPTVRDFERTPSSFDRTVEPPFGASYDLPTPEVWRSRLENGIEIFGIENNETPLVTFSLLIDAGRDRGDTAKPAVPNLAGDMLLKGTQTKSAAELEDAIKSLGSSIGIYAGQFGVYVSGDSLERNFDATIALVEEVLLEPRWDTEEFEILKRARLNAIDQAAGDPGSISSRESAKLRYPEDHMFAYMANGTRAKLEATTLDDLKAFHAAHYAPAGAKLSIAGAVDREDVARAFSGLAARWTKTGTPKPSLPQPREVDASRIYFYDVPGAKQSVIRVERPSLRATDPDFPPRRRGQLSPWRNLHLAPEYGASRQQRLYLRRAFIVHRARRPRRVFRQNERAQQRYAGIAHHHSRHPARFRTELHRRGSDAFERRAPARAGAGHRNHRSQARRCLRHPRLWLS